MTIDLINAEWPVCEMPTTHPESWIRGAYCRVWSGGDEPPVLSLMPHSNRSALAQQ